MITISISDLIKEEETRERRAVMGARTNKDDHSRARGAGVAAHNSPNMITISIPDLINQ